MPFYQCYGFIGLLQSWWSTVLSRSLPLCSLCTWSCRKCTKDYPSPVWNHSTIKMIWVVNSPCQCYQKIKTLLWLMGFGHIKSFLRGFQLHRAKSALSYIQGILPHTSLNLRSILLSVGLFSCQKHRGGEHMTFPFSAEVCIKSWLKNLSSGLVVFLSFFTSHSETNCTSHFTNSMYIGGQIRHYVQKSRIQNNM